MDELEVPKELATEGLQPFYDRMVEQLGSLDQKAQAMVSLEGLLLALIAVFSTSISTHDFARAATWASMTLLLASALSSLMVLRIRYGTTIIARAANVEEGLRNMKKWRDSKLRFHSAALRLLGAGLFGLVIVLTIVLL